MVTAPAAERAALAEAVHLLAGQLDEGVDELTALVSAAGHAVAAGSAGAPPARLADATDHLTGSPRASESSPTPVKGPPLSRLKRTDGGGEGHRIASSGLMAGGPVGSGQRPGGCGPG